MRYSTKQRRGTKGKSNGYQELTTSVEMENDLRHNEEEDDWLRRRQVGVEDGNRIGLGEDERRGSSIQLSPAEGEQAGMPIAEQQEKAAVNKGVGDMVEGSEVRVDPVPEFRSSMAPTATRLAWLLRSRPVDVPHAVPSNPTRNELGRRKTVGADKSDRRQRTARSARLPASGFPVSMGLVGNWRGSLSFASQYGADQELKMSPNVAGGVLEVGGAGGDGERKQGATGDPETSADGRLTSTAKTAGPAAVMASGVGGKNGSTNAPQSDTGTPGVAATGLQGGGPTGGRGVVGPHVEYAHETSQPIFVILLTLMAGTVGGLLLAVCVLFACKYCNRRHYGNGLNWQERYDKRFSGICVTTTSISHTALPENFWQVHHFDSYSPYLHINRNTIRPGHEYDAYQKGNLLSRYPEKTVPSRKSSPCHHPLHRQQHWSAYPHRCHHHHRTDRCSNPLDCHRQSAFQHEQLNKPPGRQHNPPEILLVARRQDFGQSCTRTAASLPSLPVTRADGESGVAVALYSHVCRLVSGRSGRSKCFCSNVPTHPKSSLLRSLSLTSSTLRSISPSSSTSSPTSSYSSYSSFTPTPSSSLHSPDSYHFSPHAASVSPAAPVVSVCLSGANPSPIHASAASPIGQFPLNPSLKMAVPQTHLNQRQTTHRAHQSSGHQSVWPLFLAVWALETRRRIRGSDGTEKKKQSPLIPTESSQRKSLTGQITSTKCTLNREAELISGTEKLLPWRSKTGASGVVGRYSGPPGSSLSLRRLHWICCLFRGSFWSSGCFCCSPRALARSLRGGTKRETGTGDGALSARERGVSGSVILSAIREPEVPDGQWSWRQKSCRKPGYSDVGRKPFGRTSEEDETRDSWNADSQISKGSSESASSIGSLGNIDYLVQEHQVEMNRHMFAVCQNQRKGEGVEKKQSEVGVAVSGEEDEASAGPEFENTDCDASVEANITSRSGWTVGKFDEDIAKSRQCSSTVRIKRFPLQRQIEAICCQEIVSPSTRQVWQAE